MKRAVVGVALALGVTSLGNAQTIQWEPVTSGSMQWQSGASRPNLGYESGGGYQGASGARYQYDLSNPADRDRYSVDLGAQRRDMVDGQLDVGRQPDRLRGQYGGGYQGR